MPRPSRYIQSHDAASQVQSSLNAQTKGDAEAFAINEKSKADAEVMKMKADAWNEFKGAWRGLCCVVTEKRG